MDIMIEDALVYDDLDIFQVAGGKNIGYSVEIPNIVVNDGFLTIAFKPVKQYPMVSGIEVFVSSAVSPTNAPVATPITVSPTNAPVATPTTVSPTNVPVATPITVSPINTPTLAPVPKSIPPALTTPTLEPIFTYPTAAPLALPPGSPPVKPVPPGSFRDIFINCGGM
jgi:Malectin domain